MLSESHFYYPCSINADKINRRDSVGLSVLGILSWMLCTDDSKRNWRQYNLNAKNIIQQEFGPIWWIEFIIQMLSPPLTQNYLHFNNISAMSNKINYLPLKICWQIETKTVLPRKTLDYFFLSYYSQPTDDDEYARCQKRPLNPGRVDNNVYFAYFMNHWYCYSCGASSPNIESVRGEKKIIIKPPDGSSAQMLPHSIYYWWLFGRLIGPSASILGPGGTLHYSVYIEIRIFSFWSPPRRMTALW